MQDSIPDSVESKAAIAGHPIHPMLVPLPIGFLVAALISDIAYLNTHTAFWAEASRWLLIAGFVSGLLAAIFGLIDFLSISYVRSRTAAWVHFLGNLLMLIITLANFLMRSSGAGATVTSTGMILSLIQVLILVVTGWLGGELSYRYRIGVLPRRENLSEPSH
jgi:uncharacterized membrane protein